METFFNLHVLGESRLQLKKEALPTRRIGRRRESNGLTLPHWNGILLQVSVSELSDISDPVLLAVVGILLVFSLLSFTIIFSKWGGFRRARKANQRFLRAFRKSAGLEPIAAAVEQFRAAPLATVFDFGYSELSRQKATRSKLTNLVALERSLQMGISEEITRLERNMNWLATAAAVCPFIGLFGTVLGIIEAFNGLGVAGSTSLRAVAPGIAKALYATAFGLGAAIPAAIAYNYFNNGIKEIGQRLEDFSLEFLNVAERADGS
jgi:biopolymer transport protein TolQ